MQCNYRRMRPIPGETRQGLHDAFQVPIREGLIEVLGLARLTIKSKDDGLVRPGLVPGRIATLGQGKAQLILFAARNQQADLGFGDMSHRDFPDPGIELNRETGTRQCEQDSFIGKDVIRVARDAHPESPVLG